MEDKLHIRTLNWEIKSFKNEKKNTVLFMTQWMQTSQQGSLQNKELIGTICK